MTEDQIRSRSSASMSLMLEMCPFALKARLMSPPAKEGSAAATGRETHTALELGDFSTLEGQQLWVAETSERQANELLAEFFGNEPFTVYKEERIYRAQGRRYTVIAPTNVGTLEWSGKADVVAIGNDGTCVAIIDYKVLSGDHGTAVENRQLRSLAAAWGEYLNTDTVRVGLIQPLLGPQTMADFTAANNLPMAAEWLDGLIVNEKASTIDDARAGAWCHWCPAKVWCPAYAAMLDNTFGEVATPDFPPASKGEVAVRVMELPAAKLTAMLDSRACLLWAKEALEDEARRRIEAGEDIGYELKPGALIKFCASPQKALDALAQHGVTVSDVLESCTVSVPALREFVRVRSGGEKITAAGVKKYSLTIKDAAGVCDCALLDAGCLTEKRNAPSLTKKKLLTE